MALMCKMFVSVVIFLFLVCLNTYCNSGKKTHIIYYNALKGLFTLYLSLTLFNSIDINSFISIVPEKNIDINIMIYTLIITVIISVIELNIDSHRLSVNITLSDTDLRRFSKNVSSIYIKHEEKKPVVAYILMEIHGNISNIEGCFIEVQLPASVTAQYNTTLVDDKGKLKIKIDDIVFTAGFIALPFDIMSNSSVKMESVIKVEISNEGNLFKRILTKKEYRELNLYNN